ncbi:replication initiation protein (plasmid) [Thioclava litoralis]|uniref:Replication initiation protein n=1 Tax=Thioclava litoralis TaxID=3076557 RepID=A0ABZ1E4V9_9RHOB|nr:replication initiation protein [Thioclava sp. FTW29]
MREITVPSSVVALRSDLPLAPAMVSAIWEIAAALDEQRIPATLENAIWLEVPTKRLRGEGSRADNVWLRECLRRLTKVELSGEHKGDPWGAVVLAQWHIVQGGSVARLLIPPAGVHALRSPTTFTKIEATAAHQLSGHGRRLYAILADKKRLGRPYWTFSLEELRALLGVDDKKSYSRWNNFRQWVLEPALEAINDYGTVTVKMTPEKRGRSVHAVRFDWRWKDPHDAAETATENERHSSTRRKQQETEDAPPMIEDPKEAARLWWEDLSEDERDSWANQVGREAEIGGVMRPRPERIIREIAFAASGQGGQAAQ